MELKSQSDPFYKKFLNKHGDSIFSEFFVAGEEIVNKKGLYLYSIAGDVEYIGRSLDPFRERINNGYGKIQPKNCYIDGQSTNCRLNALITKNKEHVSLFICEMSDNKDIIEAERALIEKYSPPWNIL